MMDRFTSGKGNLEAWGDGIHGGEARIESLVLMDKGNDEEQVKVVINEPIKPHDDIERITMLKEGDQLDFSILFVIIKSQE